jgi:prefoldin subunit 5
MGHEKLGDTVEDLEGIERMLSTRLNELDTRKALLEAELHKVQEKLAALRGR